jgi:hypothetical protein
MAVEIMNDDFLDNEDWPVIDEEEQIQFIYDAIKKSTGLTLEKELIKMVLDYELDFLDEKGLTEEVIEAMVDMLSDESEDEEDGLE